jgi:hypothetical protein
MCLHPLDAVLEGVAMAAEPLDGPLPLPILFDERLQRADQLSAVVVLRLLKCPEHRVAEQRDRRIYP